jgi:hypothetical protein
MRRCEVHTGGVLLQNHEAWLTGRLVYQISVGAVSPKSFTYCQPDEGEDPEHSPIPIVSHPPRRLVSKPMAAPEIARAFDVERYTYSAFLGWVA